MSMSNPLLSAHPSDSGLQVALHPLVLLTISDYITRHTLRRQTGPTVGALIGQQNGREVTIENAFECKVEEKDGAVVLHEAWFEDRLKSMKDVHKDPPLDLVGWYTIIPPTGPQSHHLSVHEHILNKYHESPLLLGFHPSAVGAGGHGKLPLTIYESNYEADDTDGEDKEMRDADSGDLKLKFRELSYTVETGAAERIAVDFVARGGGNATAIDTTSQPTEKGKGKAPPEVTLSREDEEHMAALTAKINAVKMLQARIGLLTTYLEQLEPSYVTPDAGTDGERTPVSYAILRSIQALLNRLPVLASADTQTYATELAAERNDVDVVALLALLTQSVTDAREMGRKSQIVENERPDRHRTAVWDANVLEMEALDSARGLA